MRSDSDRSPVEEEPSSSKETTTRHVGQRGSESTSAGTSAGRSVLRAVRGGGRMPRDPDYDFPGVDSDEEDLWELVCTKKPPKRRVVLYVGRVRADGDGPAATQHRLERYVRTRSRELELDEPIIFNSRSFQQPDSLLCGVRITVAEETAPRLLCRTFWPRPVSARPWTFS